MKIFSRSRVEASFANDWLKNDPGFVCEYCGGRMKAQSTGTIREITFYKQVPAGVKDQRVKLGAYWYARPAPLLICKGCGREYHR